MSQTTLLSSMPTLNTSLRSRLSQQLLSLELGQNSPTDEDYDRAEELMEEHRVETKSRRTGEYSIKEANPVLTKVAKGYVAKASPGLVQALLEYDADVSFARHKSTNIFKKMAGKDQVDIPNDVLDQATRNCSSEIVYVLAQNADERALNQALPAAVLINNPVKVSILLASGADASGLCVLFLDSVESGSDEMVESFLKETRGACQTCRNRGLVQAARLGYSQKVALLLSKGASPVYDNGAALLEAIRHGKEEVAMSIAGCQELRSQADILDMAVEAAYNQEQYLLLEECLQAGAKGPATERALIMAVERHQKSVIDIFSQYGASTTNNGAKALDSAIESGQHDVVKTILQGRPPRPVLAASILKAVNLPDPQTAYQMVSLLIEAGLHGDGVSEMLVVVLDKPTMRGHDHSQQGLLQLLLARGGADVNIRGGEPICKAIAKGQTDVLSLLLRYRPSTTSLNAALTSTMGLDNPSQRQNIVQMILNTGSSGIPDDIIRQDQLMQVALSAAGKRLLREDLEILVGMAPSRAAYFAGFAAATSSGQSWLTDDGLGVVQLLLDGGISGVAVDDAFCQAARLYHQDGVELLREYASNAAFDKALAGIVAHSEDWLSSENLWLFELLVECQLEKDCKGTSLSLALVVAIRASKKDHDSMTIIEDLLSEGVRADVNYNEGEALKIAIRSGDTALLKRLIASGATKVTLMEAFITAITAPLEEQQVLDALDALFSSKKDAAATFDVRGTLKTGLPPMAACLSVHPQSHRLVERLASLGCDLKAKIPSVVCEEKDIGQEYVNLLLWALGSREFNISSTVISALINSGVDINFISPRSKSSALIIAAKNERSDIVSFLLKANANPLHRDHSDRSALFYASQRGDLKSVKKLIATKFKMNDGSLHEAARNLHHEVVAVLIEAKHSANFSSRRHNGRTALQELVSQCSGIGDIVRLEQTLSALEKGNCDFWAKCGGKNALFLALENPQPILVVTALLDSMWESLSSEENNFTELDPRTGHQLIFSPTMYIIKERFRGDFVYRSKLLEMLHQAGCQDRYYIKFPAGDFKSLQPPDALGMPKAIAEVDAKRRAEEEKRRARDFEHDEKMRREREEMEQKVGLDRLKHSQKISQAAEQAEMAKQQQQEALELKREAAEMKRRSRKSG